MNEIPITGPELGELIKKGFKPQTLKDLLNFGLEMQERLLDIETEEKLSVMSELAERWKNALDMGELDDLVSLLSRKTGYCEKMIRMDLEYVSTVLDPDAISISLEQSLPGGIESLDAFVEVESGEMYRCMPAGPVLIIGSGNSVLPVVISGVLSLMTNNFTLIRPSKTNLEAVFSLFRMLREMASEETPIAETAREISNASFIFYDEIDGEILECMLKKCDLGVVNFWGDESALSEIEKALSANPHYPRYCFLAPMTGYAIVHQGADLKEAAHALAEALVYYDQQLSSSPTEACFIGNFESAKEFAEEVRKALEGLTSEFPIKKTDYEEKLIMRVRNKLRMSGSYVLVPSDGGPDWTLVVSDGKSNLERIFPSVKEFTLKMRRRFIEIIVTESESDVVERLRILQQREPFEGIIGVQSVGLSVPDAVFETLTPMLAVIGVHRIIPLKDMHLRSPIEPFDGKHMASEFVNIIYVRKE
ncbi:MAG TPA: hypothetical protein EYP68_00820 [Candidatus Korarchaeota archaeon]|nr:hypothetical protein [Candidatus Korarchaeota archaeon]